MCEKQMKLKANKQQLEEYFAKKYTKKYIEFGGYFHLQSYRNLTKSPMEHYFSSGKYKELNDPVLENYWKEIRRLEFFRNTVFVVIIILFYVLTQE